MVDETRASGTDITMRDYVDMLRRRRAIIIQTFVVVLVVGIIVTFMTKPLYRASTRILVEGKSVYVSAFDPSNPLGNLFSADASHDVDSQLEVLQGEKVLSDAYQAAGVTLGTASVQAKQSGSTDLIDISIESNDPVGAVKLANALPKVYLKYVVGNRRSEIANALDFAQKRSVDEDRMLNKAENDLELFRERSHVTNVETERTQRINDKVAAEAALRTQDARVAGLQARLSALETTRKALPAVIDTTSGVATGRIERLQDQMAELETDRARAALLYKPASLEIRKIDTHMRDLQRRLDAISPTVKIPNPAIDKTDDAIAQVKTDLLEAQSSLNDTRTHAAGRNNGLDRFGSLERDQARLQREITRHEALLAMFTKSVDDLTLRAKATHDPVVVISQAKNAEQIAPQKLNNLAVAIALGLVLGLCFALTQEFLDDRINSPEEAQRIFRVPALGFIPFIEDEVARVLGTGRGGTLLETYRVLRSNVTFASVDSPMNSIMVTSTIPGEGKSLTAYNLAVAMALEGRTVILVDADLRRPSVHKLSNVDRRPGLVNVLVGHTPLIEALQETTVPNLRVLAAGPAPPNPAEMLNSDAMRTLRAQLETQADVVIYDTPPCLATADAQLLSAHMGGVIYVANFGETKRSAMRRASELLAQAKAHVIGVVFNKIDISSTRDDYYYGYYRYFQYYDQSGEMPTLGLRTGQRLSYREFESLISKNGDTEVLSSTDDDEKAEKSV